MIPAARLRWLASLGAALGALIVYVVTLAPSVDFIDAGELAAVAHTWGIAHPTGYPLFTLLAGIWAKLPLGDGIYRLNLFAAVASAAAVGVSVQLFYVLLGVHEGRAPRKKKGKKNSPPVKDQTDDTVRLLSAVGGAFILGFSGTFWRTALSIEVYSLHVLMLSLMLWSSAVLLFSPASDSRMHRRRLLVTALLLGLSFCNHMSTIFLLPGLAVLVLWKHAAREGFWRDAALAVAVFAAALLPYLYLPLRAAAHPWLNWGNPVTAEALYRHLSGAQYSVWMFTSFDAWKEQFVYAFTAFGRDLVYVGLATSLLGIVIAWRRSARLSWYLLLLFVTCLVWAAGYDIHDIDSYFLLAYFVLAAWSAFALADAARWMGKTGARMLGVSLLAAVLVFLVVNGPRVSQRDNHLVEDYTSNMFASLGQNALVISYQWDYWVSAAYYYQQVEGRRPDVIVLDKELFRRSWYLEQLRNNYPRLTALVADEMARFEKELVKFENDLPYNAAVIEGAFNGLINAIIEKSYVERPVYLTIEMEEQFAPGFERVPEGLAFRLYRPQDVPPADVLDYPEFRYRPFETDERLAVAMMELYANMLSNRGIYMHNAGMYDKAGELFDRALAVAPGSAAIIGWKQRNAAARAAAIAP
jgi:tetratricopeptide (TPR) repeat protein